MCVCVCVWGLGVVSGLQRQPHYFEGATPAEGRGEVEEGGRGRRKGEVEEGGRERQREVGERQRKEEGGRGYLQGLAAHRH